jgi:uncharacterized protein affecting Mg2+/Co2+ transport
MNLQYAWGQTAAIAQEYAKVEFFLLARYWLNRRGIAHYEVVLGRGAGAQPPRRGGRAVLGGSR